MKNNNEKCEEMMNQYLMLDKNEKLPFKLSLHMLFCKKCRTQIKMLKIAEKTASEPIKIQVPFSDSSIEAVMNQIAPEAYKKLTKKPISFSAWIVAGIIMVVLLFISTVKAQNFDNRNLSISYALLIAISVTIYSCAFVIGNIDYFVKKISTGIKLN